MKHYLLESEGDVIAVVRLDVNQGEETFKQKVVEAVSEHFIADEDTTKIINANFNNGNATHFKVECVDNGELNTYDVYAEEVAVY